ncbi:MAG TPA: DUF5666 domain-containing protein [Candidatus Saccharimonadales bacterium]|nr:DUF5666 domain-containing protein [Candidatus Saccharimonadales bacterium]
MTGSRRNNAKLIALVVFGLALQSGAVRLKAQDSQPPASQLPAARALGTVKSISGKNIALSPDAGTEISVTLQDGARLLRVEPGEKDLKNAVPLALQDLQPGDRVLVRGKMAEDGKSLLAVSLIAMKKMDIAQKQSHEREEWQRHGVGGLVSGVEPSSGTITITTTAPGANKNVVIHVSKDTVLRRYSANSIKFDDAKPAPINEVKPGDQLRARGSRSADGSEVTADEIVSGSFRNIAGTITSIDSSAGTITVMDLSTKKPVVIKVSGESQLRKLPPPMAQRIAARLKGPSGDAPSASATGAGSGEVSATNARSTTGSTADADSARRSGQNPADLQQAISRMPAAALSDLNKGDAVMIVATQDGGVTAITLLAGVEPILEASPKNGQSILSPWSLSAGGSDAAGP